MRSPGDDQAKRPREVGVGGLDLSFRREEGEEDAASEGDLVSICNVEEERREDEEKVEKGWRMRRIRRISWVVYKQFPEKF